MDADAVAEGAVEGDGIAALVVGRDGLRSDRLARTEQLHAVVADERLRDAARLFHDERLGDGDAALFAEVGVEDETDFVDRGRFGQGEREVSPPSPSAAERQRLLCSLSRRVTPEMTFFASKPGCSLPAETEARSARSFGSSFFWPMTYRSQARSFC